jgi:hypothetical protein
LSRRFALITALALALPVGAAHAEGPIPTPTPSPAETISGTIVYYDGAPAADLRYYYDNADCVTDEDIDVPRDDSPLYETLPTSGANGTFAFPSYAGQCYWITVLDESGETLHYIEGEQRMSRIRVNSGSAGVVIKIRAKNVSVTLKGASAGSRAWAYGFRVPTQWDEYYSYKGLQYETRSAWSATWSATVGAGGKVSFSAAIGTKYTVSFEGDSKYYPQLPGGRTGSPNELSPRQFKFFEVPADSSPVSATYSLKKWGPAAKFKPKIKGKKFAPGKKVEATNLPKGWACEFRWYIDGLPIRGATRKTYTPKTADAGGKLSVAVTALNPGYRSATKHSKAVRLAKARPTVTATLVKRSIRAADRGELVVKVKVKGMNSPEGKIRVQVGGKKQTVALKEYDQGEVTIELPKLRRGTHKIKVTYLGSPQVSPQSKTPTPLTVT